VTANYQPWNPAYGVNWVPTYRMDQPFLDAFAPHRQPQEDEVGIELMNPDLLKERLP